MQLTPLARPRTWARLFQAVSAPRRISPQHPLKAPHGASTLPDAISEQQTTSRPIAGSSVVLRRAIYLRFTADLPLVYTSSRYPLIVSGSSIATSTAHDDTQRSPQ